jgi:hypothetical protein
VREKRLRHATVAEGIGRLLGDHAGEEIDVAVHRIETLERLLRAVR